MCYFDTIWVHYVLDDNGNSNKNTHKPNVILNDTQIKRSQTRKTHHALNIDTNVNFLLEHNILSPSKTHSGASWTPFCWDMSLDYVSSC